MVRTLGANICLPGDVSSPRVILLDGRQMPYLFDWRAINPEFWSSERGARTPAGPLRTCLPTRRKRRTRRTARCSAALARMRLAQGNRDDAEGLQDAICPPSS